MKGVCLRALPAWVLALCLMAGCGFQLRTWDLAHLDLHVHVKADGMSTVAGPLRSALRQAGAALSQSAADADVVVDIQDERRTRHVASVTAGARAAEYEVETAVQYAIRTPQETLQEPRWVQAARVFTIDSNSLVGSSEEQVLIEQELQTDLVGQILRNLNALTAADAG